MPPRRKTAISQARLVENLKKFAKAIADAENAFKEEIAPALRAVKQARSAIDRAATSDPGTVKLIHSGTLKLIHPFVQWSPEA